MRSSRLGSSRRQHLLGLPHCKEHLDVATTEHAVHSVGAAVVMFCAQFGIGITIGEDKSNLLRSVFTLDVDLLRSPQDCYIPVPPVAGKGWEWDLIDYPF